MLKTKCSRSIRGLEYRHSLADTELVHSADATDATELDTAGLLCVCCRLIYHDAVHGKACFRKNGAYHVSIRISLGRTDIVDGR